MEDGTVGMIIGIVIGALVFGIAGAAISGTRVMHLDDERVAGQFCAPLCKDGQRASATLMTDKRWQCFCTEVRAVE